MRVLSNVERVVVDLTGQSVGERRHVVDLHDVSRGERQRHRRGVLALRADDSHARRHGANETRASAEQSAAADADDERREVGQVAEDL